MGSLGAFPLTVILKLVFVLSLCQAIQLEEIRPWKSRAMGPRGLVKRDMSVFELKSIETFLWGAKDGTDAMLGNLTVFMPGNNENILSMEKFKGMLTSVKCNRHGMTLAFEDDASFAYAQRTWDWVNGADNHTFVMVAGQGNCGNNTRRLPYLVSTIAYDGERNTARLTATLGSWKDLLHSYELRVGSVPISSDLGLAKREWTKEASLDMSANLNFKKEVKAGPVFGEIVCDPCYTTGKMNFEIVVEVRLSLQVNLRFRVAPQGVTARARLALKVGSELRSEPITFKESMIKIPLSGISIPGDILTIGPVLDISVGGELSAFEGSITVAAGATATLPDTAVLQADLLNPSNNEFSSWIPRIVKDDFTLQAKLSFSVQMFLEPALKLQAEALGNGLEAGLELKFPYVESEVEAIASLGGGACDTGDPYQGALKLTPQAGIEATFTAGKIKGDKDVDITLGSAPIPLGNPLCFGFAEKKSGSEPGSLPGTATQPSTGGSNPSPSSSQSGKSCTVKITGKTGTCMATTSCSGTSTPGYCPDAPSNVMCCTTATSSKTGQGGSSCTVKTTGKTGTCMPTASCGGTSTSGYCPNDPTDVQCCTASAPSDNYNGGETCTVKTTGKTGTCISKTLCAKSSGTSTPGYCLNDPTDVQCCTADSPPPPPSKKESNSSICLIGSESPSAGECISTSSCSSFGGKSTPGHCPGTPNDIQCCTYEGCKTPGGESGECIPTQACNGKSTPKLCKGGNDIQCCTT